MDQKQLSFGTLIALKVGGYHSAFSHSVGSFTSLSVSVSTSSKRVCAVCYIHDLIRRHCVLLSSIAVEYSGALNPP